MKKAVVCLMAVSLFACGSSSDDDSNKNNNNPAGPDAGTDSSALVMSNPEAISLNLPAHANEKAVTGILNLQVKQQWATEPKLKLNDTAIPVVDNAFELSRVPTLSVQPGATLSLQGSGSGKTVSLSVQCPTDVTITAPTATTSVGEGDKITVTWEGTVDYDSGDLESYVAIWPLNSTSGSVRNPGPGAHQKYLTAGMTSAELTVPAPNDWDSYEIRLVIPGNQAKDAAGSSVACQLSKRLVLDRK